MASDDVPPPEGVAHTVAAHTSRITQVLSSPRLHPNVLELLGTAMKFCDAMLTCVDIEIPSPLRSSYALYNIQMDWNRRITIRVHVTYPHCSRMVHRYTPLLPSPVE